MLSLTKVCSKCGQTYPLTDFYTHPNTRDGRQSWCKHCARNKDQRIGLDTPVRLVILSNVGGFVDHRNHAWLSIYLAEWTCASCGTASDLGLYHPTLRRFVTDDEVIRCTTLALKTTVRVCEVWCRACIVAGRYLAIGKMKRILRQEMVEERIQNTDLRANESGFRFGRREDTAVVGDAMIVTSKLAVTDQIKQQLSCAVCGENDVVTLDFHHIVPHEKAGEIAKMARDNTGLDDLLTEIEKCAVVCANCHRRLHHHVESWDNLVPIRLEWKHA